MKSAPPPLIQRFTNKLIPDPSRRERVLNALEHPTPLPEAVIWLRKDPPQSCELKFHSATPDWCPPFVSILEPGQRPGATSMHAAGEIYCLDPSSVFSASPLLSLSSPIETVLDVCAAPGGKGIFAWRAHQPKLLLANEIIRDRFRALVSNFERCDIKPSAAVSVDPALLAKFLPNSFDCVIVDAPCSGQSLLAKGDKVPGCFHPTTISKCEKRQRRILAESATTVAPGGYLLYMTCTFARDENEDVIEWFLKKFPHYRSITVPKLQAHQSEFADIPCYRLWPDSGVGAGGFTALFQRDESGEKLPISFDELRIPWKR